jgi:hypothetical protein
VIKFQGLSYQKWMFMTSSVISMMCICFIQQTSANILHPICKINFSWPHFSTLKVTFQEHTAQNNTKQFHTRMCHQLWTQMTNIKNHNNLVYSNSKPAMETSTANSLSNVSTNTTPLSVSLVDTNNTRGEESLLLGHEAASLDSRMPTFRQNVFWFQASAAV